jgi:hypothetical protein
MSNYVERRIIQQYKESPDLVALLDSFIDNGQPDVMKALQDMSQRLDIDAMSGINLDLIGEIIGFPRPVSLGDEAEYIEQVFAYSSDGSVELDTQRGYGFGEYAASQEFPPMPDDDYRRFLKVKIIRNNSNKTILDCQRAALILLDAEPAESFGVTWTTDNIPPTVQSFIPTQTGTYTIKVEGTLTNTSETTGALTAFANIATLAGVLVFSGNADRATTPSTAAGEQGVLGTYEREVTLVEGTTYRIGTFFGGNTGIEASDDTLTISLLALQIVEESFSPHAVTFRGSAPANPAFIKALEDVAPVADGINVVYEQL